MWARRKRSTVLRTFSMFFDAKKRSHTIRGGGHNTKHCTKSENPPFLHFFLPFLISPLSRREIFFCLCVNTENKVIQRDNAFMIVFSPIFERLSEQLLTEWRGTYEKNRESHQDFPLEKRFRYFPSCFQIQPFFGRIVRF